MGRPVRYGGEMGGVRERTAYMAEIAARVAGAGGDRGQRPVPPRAWRASRSGVVFVIAPWNYPFLTAINTIVPALIAGNARGAEAREPDAARRRAAGAGLRAPAGGALHQRLPRPCDHVGADRRAGLRLHQLHRQRPRRPGDRARRGRHLRRPRAGARRQGPGLRPRRRRPRRRGRHADGRGDVQLRPVLLRHRADLRRTRSLYDAFVEKSVAWVSGYRLGSPLEQATTLGPMATQALRRHGARPGRRGGGGRGEAADRPGALPGRHRRQRLSRAADPGRRRPLDAGDDRGELRAGRRDHAGQGRRGGDPADERQPLRPDRLGLDRRRRHGGGDRRAASRPARSS